MDQVIPRAKGEMVRDRAPLHALDAVAGTHGDRWILRDRSHFEKAVSHPLCLFAREHRELTWGSKAYRN